MVYVAYDAGLDEVIWEHAFDEPITTLAADRQFPRLAVGIGYEGLVCVIDATTGQTLATEQAMSVVNGLAIAQGHSLAAATEDGHLALIRYLSKELHL